ncbi:MAG: cytochrome b [Betaproteobacteria bacterium]
MDHIDTAEQDLPQRYSGTAKVLHWLMALMILGLFAVGQYMSDLSMSPTKLQLYSWHKWFGVTAFLLVLIRLGWRLTHQPPTLPLHMSTLQQRASHLAHAALYGLMLAIPVSGWLMSSAKGYQTVWFGVLPIPDVLAKDKSLGDLLAEVHGTLNGVLMLIVFIHVIAALKHHFIDRDDILKRMLPSRQQPSPPQ